MFLAVFSVVMLSLVMLAAAALVALLIVYVVGSIRDYLGTGR
jgi:hypothetical protein